MIFRLSHKLAKKIKEAPTDSLPPDSNPLADWSGHVFTGDRTQYILLTNTASLYSVVMSGRGITDDNEFLNRSLDGIREFMVEDGLEFFYQKFISPASGTVEFSKALNRSVTGSMNDMIYHATMWLVEVGLSTFETSLKLNEIPMSPLGYQDPRTALKALLVGNEDS